MLKNPRSALIPLLRRIMSHLMTRQRGREGMHLFIGQQRSNMLLRLGTLALLAYTSHGFVMSLGCGPSERALSRREAISKVSLAGDESNHQTLRRCEND